MIQWDKNSRDVREKWVEMFSPTVRETEQCA
jgi:hypothetical protein